MEANIEMRAWSGIRLQLVAMCCCILGLSFPGVVHAAASPCSSDGYWVADSTDAVISAGSTLEISGGMGILTDPSNNFSYPVTVVPVLPNSPLGIQGANFLIESPNLFGTDYLRSGTIRFPVNDYYFDFRFFLTPNVPDCQVMEGGYSFTSGVPSVSFDTEWLASQPNLLNFAINAPSVIGGVPSVVGGSQSPAAVTGQVILSGPAPFGGAQVSLQAPLLWPLTDVPPPPPLV